MTKAKIIYSGFYDTPLAFVVWHGDMQLLFWRVFDDVIDDFPDEYKVFVLPNVPEEIIKSSWQHLDMLATRFLGVVPIRKIEFDPSKREEIDTSVINDLTETAS